MSHDHDHGQGHDFKVEFTQDFWDDFYQSAEKIWSGQPNLQLVAQTADLTPGEALDAGCGEGGDAIWLASQGWTVTAADVSAVVLERAAANAAARGAAIAGRITWRHQDLYATGPGQQRFDLVSAQFIHFRDPGLESMHRRLAAAVRPGGTLLVVTHHPDDLHANVGRSGRAGMLLLPGELAAPLDPGSWDILVADAIGRPATDLDGQPVTVTDTVLRAVRRR